MKHLFLKALAVATVLGGISFELVAQQKTEKNEIKVRIEKDVNGQKTVQERTINTTGMSESERDAVLDSVQNQMMKNGELAQKRVKVIIEDGKEMNNDKESRFEWNTDNDENVQVYRFKGDKPHVRIQKRGSGNDFDWDSEAWENEFEFKMERLGDKLKYLGDDIPRRIEKNIFLMDNGKSAPIRSVDTFPNRPDSHIINVKFYAPNEGDVAIKIIDINGKTVASEEAKAFKGEYVGQIKLKKDTKGTFFVIVSQGDDGVSKRIVLD